MLFYVTTAFYFWVLWWHQLWLVVVVYSAHLLDGYYGIRINIFHVYWLRQVELVWDYLTILPLCWDYRSRDSRVPTRLKEAVFLKWFCFSVQLFVCSFWVRINEYEFFQVKQNADLRNCKVNLEGQQHFKRLLQSIRNEKTWTFAEKKERETCFKVN